MGARMAQAQGSIHRQPDLFGIAVFLAVVFPPANRA
jgi:hypothetical protein